MVAELPWCKIRMRMGEAGSYSPTAKKRRRRSKITAKVPDGAS